MKKRILAYFMCFVLIFIVFTGCQNSANTTNTENTVDAGSTAVPENTANAGNTGKFFEITKSNFTDQLTQAIGADNIKIDNEEKEDGLVYTNYSLTEKSAVVGSPATDPVQLIVRWNEESQKIKSISLMSNQVDSQAKAPVGVLKYAGRIASIFDPTLDLTTFNEKFKLSDSGNGDVSKEINGIVYSYSNSNNSTIFSIFYPSESE